jgi:hypothetical protein
VCYNNNVQVFPEEEKKVSKHKIWLNKQQDLSMITLFDHLSMITQFDHDSKLIIPPEST